MATPMRDLLPRWYPYADDRVPTADEITSEYLGYEFLTRQLMAKIGSNEFSFSPHSRRSHRSDCTLTIKNRSINVELKTSSSLNISAKECNFDGVKVAGKRKKFCTCSEHSDCIVFMRALNDVEALSVEDRQYRIHCVPLKGMTARTLSFLQLDNVRAMSTFAYYGIASVDVDGVIDFLQELDLAGAPARPLEDPPPARRSKRLREEEEEEELAKKRKEEEQKDARQKRLLEKFSHRLLPKDDRST